MMGKIHGNTVHGMTRTKVFYAWVHIRQRCGNQNCKDFKNYGGRGIRVCERWLSFENFLADMGFPPKDGQYWSMERKDNNGNYEPSNCKWGTRKEQNTNQRRTTRLVFEGRVMSVKEWAREKGLNQPCLQRRIFKRNWTVRDSLTIPSGGQRGHLS